MDGLELQSLMSVQFRRNEDDDSCIFKFPCGGRLQVPDHDVGRSLTLRDMLESAATSWEITITFPSSVELSHFHIWAAAVQPDSPVFQADAEGMKRALEAADFLADEGLMHRLAAAFDAKLFLVEAVAPDADFLRVLEGMRGELASSVLAASSRPVGERAWRLPERLHRFDEAISDATAAVEAQRATAEGHKETECVVGCSLWQVSVSPDGVLLAICGQHGRVEVWHTATCKFVRSLRCFGPGNFFFCHAWSPDGCLLATGGYEGTVTVWDMGTGAVKVSLQGHLFLPHRSVVKSVAWSLDGHKLCSCTSDVKACVWDLATGNVVQHALDDSDSVEFPESPELALVECSPDGSRVATGTGDRSVHIWDAATGDHIRELKHFSTGCITSAAWSPLGDMLASVECVMWPLSGCGTIRVWDVATGDETHALSFLEHHSVISVAWNPDGRHLATASYDSSYDVTLTVWEVATGTSLRVMPTGAVSAHVAWSPCGSILLAATDRAVHIYNV